MINGINMINFHGASYSLKGTRKYTTGQTLSIYNNLWPCFDALSKYLEETCALLVEYPPARKIALLKPLLAARALYPSDAGEKLDEALSAASWQLLQSHMDFDLLDEDGANEWRIEDGRLRVGEVVYDSVIIPEGAAELSGLTAKPVAPCVAISGAGSEDVLAYAGYNQTGEKLSFVLNTLDREVTVEIDAVKVTLAPWESRMFKGAPETSKPSSELAVSGPWKVKAEKMNHVPLLGPSDKIIVAGAGVTFIVCESEELRSSLRIDGKTPRWEDAETAVFFDGDNLLIPVDELFGDGEHVVTFESGDELPTVLLAGDFATFPRSAHEYVLRSPINTSEEVDRVKTGYPFLRGGLVFTTSFVLAEAVGNAQLRLPGRKGAVTVTVDAREIGVVAWSPDVIAVGALAAGIHELTLNVVGDGIGLQREGFFTAGLVDGPRICT